jgi:hypothetical protein
MEEVEPSAMEAWEISSGVISELMILFFLYDLLTPKLTGRGWMWV